MGRSVPRDIMSGFFAIRTELFKKALREHPDAFEPAGYKVLVDVLKVLPRKISNADVPYDFGMRRVGSSKIGPRHVLAFLRSLLR